MYPAISVLTGSALAAAQTDLMNFYVEDFSLNGPTLAQGTTYWLGIRATDPSSQINWAQNSTNDLGTRAVRSKPRYSVKTNISARGCIPSSLSFPRR